MAGFDHALNLIFPLKLTSAFVIIALIFLTGAIHLDGFIDTCDGLAIKSSAAERLKTMSDSRVGGFGVVGGFCILLLKYASLASLSGGVRMTALILAPTLSRWEMAYSLFAFPSAKKEGMGWAFKETTRWQEVTLATIIALIVAVLLMQQAGVLILAAVFLIILGVGKYLCSKLGGLTGDTYGAINELSEAFVLILFVIIEKLGSSWLSPFLWIVSAF